MILIEKNEKGSGAFDALLMINKREQEFLDKIADKDKTYIHHPQWFYLSNNTKYMPDFYCKEDDEFIEIAGTRQAYHANKDKYELLQKEYLGIKFKIVHLWTKKNRPADGMRQRQIARQEKVTETFVSRVANGKQHTKKIELAKKIAALTGEKPIVFIMPEFRTAFLKAYPELGKKCCS